MSGTHGVGLFGRQKLLLALLHALDGRVGNLDFQKLLFLYCQDQKTTREGPFSSHTQDEVNVSPMARARPANEFAGYIETKSTKVDCAQPALMGFRDVSPQTHSPGARGLNAYSPDYEFVPYRFGAFSFTSYADRRKLIERGLLESDENNWVLSAEGRKAVGGFRTSHSDIVGFAEQYRLCRGDALIAETYRRYPYFATRSEIAARVLGDDAASLQGIEAAKPASDGPALSTIGYEGHTLESYLNQLLMAGVTLLCDVRRNPISRKYGFSKGTLSKACEGVGITYEHLPELGIDSSQRQHLETQADYDALFATYERDYLPSKSAALAEIRGWVQAGERVALTCYEHLPGQCHRHCVAEALEGEFGTVFITRHM